MVSLAATKPFFCSILATDYTNFHGLKCLLDKLGPLSIKGIFAHFLNKYLIINSFFCPDLDLGNFKNFLNLKFPTKKMGETFSSH